MKTRKFTLLIGMSLFAALAMPVGMAAQDNPSPDNKPKHKKYKLIDMGTFGGAQSYVKEQVMAPRAQTAGAIWSVPLRLSFLSISTVTFLRASPVRT